VAVRAARRRRFRRNLAAMDTDTPDTDHDEEPVLARPAESTDELIPEGKV